VADGHATVGAALRSHPRMRALQHRLTGPARRAALPVLTGNGRGLRVSVGESIMRVASRGEPQVEKAYLDLLSPGDVVYDVGANIGWYSLLAARAVGPSGSVMAFEPSLENAVLAQRNAVVNGLANITVVPAALTDEEGWMTFIQKGSLEGRLEKDDSEEQARRKANRRIVGVSGRTLVPITTLDSWLARTGRPAPTLVKIDVEGAEVGVLRGMEQTLRNMRPMLIVELHGTRDEVADQLDSLDYEHSAIERDVPTREAPWWAHVLARPAER
jgi:FkbM family methyltransferase